MQNEADRRAVEASDASRPGHALSVELLLFTVAWAICASALKQLCYLSTPYPHEYLFVTSCER